MTTEGRLTPEREAQKYLNAIEAMMDYSRRHSLYPKHPTFTDAEYSVRQIRIILDAMRRELAEARKDSARLDADLDQMADLCELLRRAVRRTNPIVADWPMGALMNRYGDDAPVLFKLSVPAAMAKDGDA